MRRTVMCIKCRLIKETTDVDPQCEICKIIMITTIRSIITGDIITGEPTEDKYYKI